MNTMWPNKRTIRSLATIFLTMMLLSSNNLLAQSLLSRTINWVDEKLSFSASANKRSKFLFTKQTPNYTAYAGMRATGGSHLVRLEQGEYGLEMQFISALGQPTIPEDTATPPETTPLQQTQTSTMISQDIQTNQALSLEEIFPNPNAKARLVEEETERVVRFDNIVRETDLVYRLVPEGLKEEILLYTPTAPTNFTFSLNAGDLSYEQKNSVIYFIDKTGKALFRIPKGWARDSAAQFTNDVETSIIEKENHELEITLTLPLSWLQDPARVFPILLDPSLDIIEKNSTTQEQSSPTVTPPEPTTTTQPSVVPENTVQASLAETSLASPQTTPEQTVQPTIETEPTIVNNAGIITSFNASQQPELVFNFAQDNKIQAPSLGSFLQNLAPVQLFSNSTIEAILENYAGEIIGQDLEIIQDNADTIRIKVPSDLKLERGVYTITTKRTQNGTTVIQEQDFGWGVLAINTNKSLYVAGETADFSFAVLDEKGDMVCDANLTLKISNESANITDELSTENDAIIVNPECQVHDFTLNPDYEASYAITQPGTYHVQLIATTNNGTFEITDSFETLTKPAPFDVERHLATRIYPYKEYPAIITITANEDFQGTVTEYVPESFLLFDTVEEVLGINGLSSWPTEELLSYFEGAHYGVERRLNDTYKLIEWNVDIKKGETYKLAYGFDAYDASPEFYTLGPLQVGTFSENRSWQLAIDVLVYSSIDTTASLNQELYENGGRNLVFTSDTTGYVFYTAGDGSTTTQGAPVYRKTTNGGLTWAAENSLSSGAQTDCENMQVWYDRWTPGDTGTKIHVIYLETGGDDVYYMSLDPGSSDAETSEAVAVSNTTDGHTSITDSISITKATNGRIYVVNSSTIGDESIVRWSTDGSSWNTTAAEGLDNSSGDSVLLMPLASGDILLTRWDLSADDIQSKEYEDGADTWDGSWTNIDTDSPESATFTESWASTINLDTGYIYLTYVANAGGAGTADIRVASYNGSSWTSKTEVESNINTIQGASIALDSNTGDLYVVYTRGSLEATLWVYYKQSTDGGTTWDTQRRGPIIGLEDDLKGIHTNLVSSYVMASWVFNDDTQDLYFGVMQDVGSVSGAAMLHNLTGFENGSDVVAGYPIDSEGITGTASVVNNSSTARSGDYYFRSNPSSSTGYITYYGAYAGTGAIATAVLDVASIQFGFRIATTPDTETIIFDFNSSGTERVSIKLDTDRHINLTVASGTTSGTYALSTATWYIIAVEADSDKDVYELRIYASDMLTIYETMYNTTAQSDFNYFRIGAQTSCTTDLYYDDLLIAHNNVVGNIPLIRGDYRITRMDLDSTGTDTAWTGDYTSTDEIPTDSTDYISISAIGDETSNMESTSSAGISGSILGVKVLNTLWEDSAVTSAQVRTVRTRSTAASETTAVDISTTITDYARVLNYNVGDSNRVWTTSALDSMQVGVGCDADPGEMNYLNGSTVTQVLYIPTITISGNVYNYGTASTALTECDGTTEMIKMRAGGILYKTTCADATGAFTFSGIRAPSAGEGIVIWIDNQSTDGALVLRYDGSGDSTGLIFYDGAVTVTSDDTTGVDIPDMNTYDYNDDYDIPYIATDDAVDELEINTGYDFIIKKASGVANGSTVFEVGGDITIIGGNLHIDDNSKLDGGVTPDISVGGSVIIDSGATLAAPSGDGNGFLQVGDDFTNNGTFTAGYGEVAFKSEGGTHTITYSSDTTFYDFTAIFGGSTLQFDESEKTIVTNSFTVTGSDCFDNRVFLESATNDNQWDLQVTGSTVDIDYADIEDSNAIITLIADNSTEDNENNTGWVINGGTCLYTSTISTPTAYSFQRKTFYDSENNRYWKFFHDGTNIKVLYSADNGDTWVETDPLTVGDYSFSVWWASVSGTEYVWIAYYATYDIYVQRGTLSTTSISWDSASIALDGSGTLVYTNPTITRDSAGYLWVAARYYNTVGGTYSIVTNRSSNPNDPTSWKGTITVNSSANATQAGAIVPLNAQDMYIIIHDGTAIKGCFFDEQGNDRWEDSSGNACPTNQDSIDTGISSSSQSVSVVADTTNYDVHLLYIEDDATDTVSYNRWDNGSGTNGTWQTEVTLDSSNNDMYVTISLDSSTDDLYAFWIDNSTSDIFYRVCDDSLASSECSTSGDWQSEITWKNLLSAAWLTSTYAAPSRAFAMWTEGASSPYTVSWDIIMGSESGTSTANSFQRKTFYDSENDRYWWFYHDGDEIDIQYSTGVQYSSDSAGNWTAIDSYPYDTDDFSVWWASVSGTEYVWMAFDAGDDIYVAEGTLTSSSISWVKAEVALDGALLSGVFDYPYITRDSSGYLWVGARYTNNFVKPTTYSFETVRSQDPNDHTAWDDMGSPSVATSASSNVYGVIVPLNSQDMYAVYNWAGTKIAGCMYDEQSSNRWEDSSGSDCTDGANVDTIDSGVTGLSKNLSAVADFRNYDVHLIYIKEGDIANDSVTYSRWDNGSGTNGSWQSAVNLDASNNDAYVSISYDSATHDLYAFYIDTSAYNIYYRMCDDSVASSECSTSGDWRSESTWQDKSSAITYLTTNYSADSRMFGTWTGSTEWDILLIEASTSSTATAYSFQRKTFYNSETKKYWMFFHDGDEIDILWSEDGIDWTETESLAYDTNDFSVWSASVSGTEYVWIVYNDGGYDVKAQRGTLGDGSITWGSSYTVLDGTSNTYDYDYPSITRDSSGYLWIGSRRANMISEDYDYITIDSRDPNDPSNWNSSIVVSPSGGTANTYGTIVPINSQDMYAIWIFDTSIQGCFWDDSDSRWEDAGGNNDCTSSPDTIDTGVTGLTKNLSAVADTTNYDVHLLYIEDDTTDTVSYARWDRSGGVYGAWQSEITIDTSGNDAYVTISIDTTTRDLYAIWMDTTANDIYYRSCDVSAAFMECSHLNDWDSETKWKDTTSGTYLTSNYGSPSRIFAQWTEGASSPYSIYWDMLYYLANTSPSAPTTLYTNESTSGAQAGESNPIAVGDASPLFSAVYIDSDSGDIANKYQIIVYSDQSCTSSVWDSGSSGTSMTNCTQGNRCGDIEFAGTGLSFDGKKYYWKIKYWDASGEAGSFSDCTANFTILGPGDQLRHGNYFFNSETERVFTW